MEIKDALKARRLELKLTMKDLAEKIGVSEGTISRWESGKISDMRRDKIMSLANALDISPAVIMGWDEYKALPHPSLIPITTRKFPLFDGIAAGEPRIIPDGIECYVDATTEVQADYAIRVHGNSMVNARINDGDIVFIREQPEVENGEIAAVAIGDEATLKRVYYYKNHSLLVLRPENPAYNDMEFSGDELDSVRILGKAVAFQSDLK